MSAVFLGFAIYFLIWWLVWFAVLPWGVRGREAPEAGHDPGAPVKAMIAIKFIATTLIAAAIFGVGYALWVSGVVSLDTLPMPFDEAAVAETTNGRARLARRFSFESFSRLSRPRACRIRTSFLPRLGPISGAVAGNPTARTLDWASRRCHSCRCEGACCVATEGLRNPAQPPLVIRKSSALMELGASGAPN